MKDFVVLGISAAYSLCQLNKGSAACHNALSTSALLLWAVKQTIRGDTLGTF